MPAASEFYAPLIAIGEPRRAEPGVPRAWQLQPLVRQLVATSTPRVDLVETFSTCPDGSGAAIRLRFLGVAGIFAAPQPERCPATNPTDRCGKIGTSAAHLWNAMLGETA